LIEIDMLDAFLPSNKKMIYEKYRLRVLWPDGEEKYVFDENPFIHSSKSRV
jgi:hypothetical protein